MLGVRRPSLVRQMAFRQDSNDCELSIRHGHLAPPSVPPDSPRPQKEGPKDEQVTNGFVIDAVKKKAIPTPIMSKAGAGLAPPQVIVNTPRPQKNGADQHAELSAFVSISLAEYNRPKSPNKSAKSCANELQPTRMRLSPRNSVSPKRSIPNK